MAQTPLTRDVLVEAKKGPLIEGPFFWANVKV